MRTYEKLGAYGRFGNQLFQVASTIGLAIAEGSSYGFRPWEHQSYFKNPLPELTEKNYHTYSGYLQDYRNFKAVEELIRFYFTLKYIDIPILKNTIFIHFRAYSTEGVQKLHPEQSKFYYLKAMNEFPGKDFVIFSDDIQLAKNTLNIDCSYIHRTELLDFYLMSKCDGGIIANSTYSWWAAWLTGGKVVIPTHWFDGAYKKDDTSGLYIKDWIQI